MNAGVWSEGELVIPTEYLLAKHGEHFTKDKVYTVELYLGAPELEVVFADEGKRAYNSGPHVVAYKEYFFLAKPKKKKGFR